MLTAALELGKRDMDADVMDTLVFVPIHPSERVQLGVGRRPIGGPAYPPVRDLHLMEVAIPTVKRWGNGSHAWAAGVSKGRGVAHRAFFSFHYEEDVTRASVVRNSEALKKQPSEFIDASLWEEAKRKGDTAIQKLIDEALIGTTVTVVLIGSETSTRKWIEYEIAESEKRGNALLGVYIHKIKDLDGDTTLKGKNPLPSKYKTYDWVDDDGYNKLGSWIDAAYDAAQQAIL